MKHILIYLLFQICTITAYSQEVRYVKVTSEDQLQESWKDNAVPNMGFTFNEKTLDQCLRINGNIYASYYPYAVNESKTVTYIDVKNGITTYTVQSGVYGIHINTTQLE